MPYTDETLSNAAYERLRAAGRAVGSSLIPRLRALIPTALELLGRRVRDSEDYQEMQVDFTATPVAGLLELSALTGILFDIDRTHIRVAATNAALMPADSVETLEHGGLPSDVVWYAKTGNALRFRSTTPSLVDYATQIKLRANYIPSLTDPARPLPLQYEGALVLTLAELGTEVRAA